MSDTLVGLKRKLDGSSDLQSVVRTMKAVAASQIAQYESSVVSLTDYFQTVQKGLVVAFRHTGKPVAFTAEVRKEADRAIQVVVFGSDQGLVGQFNDVLADFVVNSLSPLPGKKIVWAVGERIRGHLEDRGLKTEGLFSVPNSVSAISPLVSQILLNCEAEGWDEGTYPLYIFHNRPRSGAIYEQTFQPLLPLDGAWLGKIVEISWPTNNLPEILGDREKTVRSLISEYLFVSIFRACAESLASENASRLAAMQRAEKNINEMREDLSRSFHHLRQDSIDEELFDVVSGFEALRKKTV